MWRLLRVATIVDVVQVATNQQTRHLRATSPARLRQRKAADTHCMVAERQGCALMRVRVSTLAASSLALMLNVGYAEGEKAAMNLPTLD